MAVRTPFRSVVAYTPVPVATFTLGIVAEVFGFDRTGRGQPGFDFAICTERPGPVITETGLTFLVEHDLSRLVEADLVLVSPVDDVEQPPTPAVVEALRAAYQRGAILAGCCTGAFTLAATGLLDGRRATTHWMYADTMARMYPRIEVDPDVLYVQEGRIITSAGTAAGLDACLHLLRQEIGAELTNKIARRMVVAPQRDGGQAQYIDQPLPAVSSLSLAPVTDWMLENLRLELTVDQLAAKALMSPRTFARRFKADYGTTPAAWLNRQRILHAQRLLEETDLGIDAIAYECGFGSAAVLRQNFTRVLGTTPTAYRGRFSCRQSVKETVAA